MQGCESWTIKKAERWRTDGFELWCCRRLLRVPWTATRSILKEINSDFHQRPKIGQGPNPWNSSPFTKIVGIMLPLISLWNYPSHKSWPHHISRPLSPSAMAHTLWSVSLRIKSISYLSLCLSPNSFSDETQRTWASVSPGTRWVILTQTAFWLGSSPRHVGSSPNLSFSWA